MISRSVGKKKFGSGVYTVRQFTQRQPSSLAAAGERRHAAGWKLISLRPETCPTDSAAGHSR